MSVRCSSCEWPEEEVLARDAPARCPECGSRVERDGAPTNPDETISDKI